MKVSVIIPTLNEAVNIGRVLSEIPKESVDEILVVDGHSTDGTYELVKKLGYSVIYQEGKGYGAAINTGVKNVAGDIIIIMDADGSANPKDIPRLLDKISEGYDVALASRYMNGGYSYDDTFLHYIGNKVFTLLCNKIHRVGVCDSLYAFMALKKEIFNAIQMRSKDLEYCMEILIKMHKAGFKMAEIPAVERKRTHGRSKVSALYHGLQILWVIIREIFE